jgi:hypothetical protein
MMEYQSGCYEITFTPVSFYRGERFLSNSRKVYILGYTPEECIRMIESHYPKGGIIVNQIYKKYDVELISPEIVRMVCQKNMSSYIKDWKQKTDDRNLPNIPVWMNQTTHI